MRIDRPVKGGSFPWYRSQKRATLITACGLYDRDHGSTSLPTALERLLTFSAPSPLPSSPCRFA